MLLRARPAEMLGLGVFNLRCPQQGGEGYENHICLAGTPVAGEAEALGDCVCVWRVCVCVCARAWICVSECVSEQMDGWGWYWPNSQPLVKKLSSVMVKSPGFQPQLLFQLHHFLTP